MTLPFPSSGKRLIKQLDRQAATYQLLAENRVRTMSQQYPRIHRDERLVGQILRLNRGLAREKFSRIDEPDYGHLMNYMFIADGAKVPFERVIVPRVEIELAFQFV